MKKSVYLSPIDYMEATLRVFGKTLLKLNKENNMVLGGSYALLLHGLTLKKDPADVDIILYNPSEKQLNILEDLRDFNTLEPENPDYPLSVLKLKSERNGITHTLDIIVENIKMPKSLLTYKKEEIQIKIQNIAKVIEAKASYSRAKDFKDLLDLKNLNFNI